MNIQKDGRNLQAHALSRANGIFAENISFIGWSYLFYCFEGAANSVFSTSNFEIGEEDEHRLITQQLIVNGRENSVERSLWNMMNHLFHRTRRKYSDLAAQLEGKADEVSTALRIIDGALLPLCQNLETHVGRHLPSCLIKSWLDFATGKRHLNCQKVYHPHTISALSLIICFHKLTKWCHLVNKLVCNEDDAFPDR